MTMARKSTSPTTLSEESAAHVAPAPR